MRPVRIGVLVALFLQSCSEDPSAKLERELRQALLEDHEFRSAAVSFCNKQVERMLRAPATAKFPMPDLENNDDISSRYREKDNEYPELWISSYVDSQNGFGALIRTRWECTVRYRGGSPKGKPGYMGGDLGRAANWELLSLDVDDEG